MSKVSERISWEITKKSFLPFVTLFLVLAGYIFYRIKIIPVISEELQQNMTKYISTAFVVSAGFIIQRIADGIIAWYRKNVTARTKTTLDNKLIPLLGRALKTLIWVIVFLVVLPFYGVNINALIAALGVSSLAIALAAQDTIANVIAGFLIMVDTPFVIGDKIKIPSGEVVEVLDIGVRRSKFLSEDKAIIIVPNLDLSKSKIVNYTYGSGQTG